MDSSGFYSILVERRRLGLDLEQTLKILVHEPGRYIVEFHISDNRKDVVVDGSDIALICRYRPITYAI